MVCGQAIIVMGISGAGKSTVGELLAAELCCEFLDADNFHSAENKEKMKRGVALTDEDRLPWLQTLRDSLTDHIIRGQCTVLACSALRPKYRDLLRAADYEFLFNVTSDVKAVSKSNEDSAAFINETEHNIVRQGRNLSSHVVFVYLKGTADLLETRLIAREIAGTHFMPASLLQSQIDDLKLEMDEGDILEVDASMSPPAILEHIRRQLAV